MCNLDMQMESFSAFRTYQSVTHLSDQLRPQYMEIRPYNLPMTAISVKITEPLSIWVGVVATKSSPRYLGRPVISAMP